MADAPSVTVDQPQRTLHVFASREDGAVVMDLWENEDGLRRMRDDPEFRRNVEAADWPSDPKVEIYEVCATCNRAAKVPRNDTLSARWPEQSLAIFAGSSLWLLRRFRVGLPRSVVELLHIGEMDLAADLGVRPDTTASQFLYARSIVVIASRAAGLVPRAAPSAQRSTTSPDTKPRPVS